MIKFLILTMGGFLIFPSYASDYYDDLYQECNENNGKVTSKMIDHARSYCTPDGYDWPHCIDSEQLESLAHCDVPNLKAPDVIGIFKQYKWYYNSQPYEDSIPPICFLASTALGRQQWNPEKGNFRYYQCDNGLKPRDTGSLPCLSQNYIHTIAKAFNEVANCFNLNGKEKMTAFSLMHHESRFHSNKAEESGEKHRCFGQMNNKFITTLNQYIVGNDPYHTEYKKIYDKAIDRCPFLEKIVTPHPDLIKNKSNQVRQIEKEKCQQKCIGLEEDRKLCKKDCEKTDFEKVHEEHASSMICKTAEDPYSCLVYTIFNMLVTEERLKQYLLYNPKVNSMEIETSRCKTVGEIDCRQKGRDFCKKEGREDCKEREKQMCQFIGKRSCKIFNEKDFDFKKALGIWSHSGGFNGIVRTDFQKFTIYLKGEINYYYTRCNICRIGSEREKCKECNEYADYKESILNRKPLSGQILIKEFQKYSSNPKHEVSNHEQVKNIIDDIQNDLKVFQGGGKSLENAMKSLPNNPKDKQPKDGLRRADLNDFLMNVASQCPISLPSYKKVH